MTLTQLPDLKDSPVPLNQTDPMTTPSPLPPRSLTLAGLNALLSETGIVVRRNTELGLYEAHYRRLDYQGKTLLAIGRQLIRAIAAESGFEIESERGPASDP